MAGTAVVAIWAKEGFLLAADGRETQAGNLISDSVQKVFPIPRKWDTLMYGAAGITTLYRDEARSSLVFDFRGSMQSCLSDLSARPLRSFEAYVKRISKRITKSLRTLARGQSRISFPDDDGRGTVATLIIAGYYNQMPVMAKIRFHCGNNGQMETPEMDLNTRWAISMPLQIGEALLKREDPRLAKYYNTHLADLAQGSVLSLSEARVVAETCIDACKDPIALEVDEKASRVGGHTHIAAITACEGFHWLVAPQSS